MKKVSLIVATSLLFLLPCILLSNPALEPHNPFEKTESMWFDSLNVRYVGTWPMGPSTRIACDTLRDIVFLLSGGILNAIDITDMQNPVKISELVRSRIPNDYRFLFYDYSSENLYIGTTDNIWIFDVSDPLQAEQVGIINLAAGGMDIRNIYAYVAAYSSFYIIDISNPSNPQNVGHCEVAGQVVAVSGSYAYVTGAADLGFRVVDISDPENPQQIAGLWQPSNDIFILESYAYLAGGSNLAIRIIDIADPYNPQFAGYFYNGSGSGSIQVFNRIAYITNGGLRIVDVSDPANCFEIGHFPCKASAAEARGEFAYIASSDTGLIIIEIVPPSNPQQVGELVFPDFAVDVFVTGNYAFMAYSTKGIRIIDISDPTKPEEISYCDTPGKVYSVFVSGSYSYVADSTALRIIDVSIPANPVEVGSLATPGTALDIHVSGSYAYVADRSAGLRIIDISTPSAPFEVGYCDTMWATRVFVSGHYAYVITDEYSNCAGFWIIDITDPSNPAFVGYCFPYYCLELRDLFVSGMYAYVISREGLYTIDISDPSNPQEISSFYGYQFKRIGVSGLYASITDIDGWMIVVDISDPANPERVGYYHASFYGGYYHKITAGVHVVGNYAYVAFGKHGLQIYEFYGAGVEEEQPAPIPQSTTMRILQNPVEGNSIVLFLNAGTQIAVDLELYNLLGQRIKTYSLSPSAHARRKLDIHDIPAGTYFLRIAKGFAEAIKVTVIR